VTIFGKTYRGKKKKGGEGSDHRGRHMSEKEVWESLSQSSTSEKDSAKRTGDAHWRVEKLFERPKKRKKKLIRKGKRDELTR